MADKPIFFITYHNKTPFRSFVQDHGLRNFPPYVLTYITTTETFLRKNSNPPIFISVVGEIIMQEI